MYCRVYGQAVMTTGETFRPYGTLVQCIVKTDKQNLQFALANGQRSAVFCCW